MLQDVAARTFAWLRAELRGYTPRLRPVEVGQVARVAQGIAVVRGLPGVRADELVRCASGVFGMAAGLEEEAVGVILLGPTERVRAGDEVRRTGRVANVPVGATLLGRVVDPLGRPLDDQPAPPAEDRRPVERPAPAILDRAPVSVPLQTGWKVVDALIPIGRGQRELILGDRQTGKTAVALNAMLNQRDTGVLCVYCAIGQRAAAVAKVIATLRERGALDHSLVVVAGGEDPPGLQFLAPYAATTMAEYFMERGRDVLVVYDDLTRHARAYRELSLLLRRPPGREAYPGDIFYIHSRLLERATHLHERLGGGSVTALPIVETQAQNISAYIPTNLISITDGQIYLSPEFLQHGQLPAIDVGKSVSRVGGKAQLPAYRAVAGDLRLAYAQYEELETFARFSTRLDEATRRRLERGRRVREILKQREGYPLGVGEQISVLFAAAAGVFDPLPVEQTLAAADIVQQAVLAELPDLVAAWSDGGALREDARDRLRRAIQRALGEHGFAARERASAPAGRVA